MFSLVVSKFICILHIYEWVIFNTGLLYEDLVVFCCCCGNDLLAFANALAFFSVASCVGATPLVKKWVG